MDPLAWVRRLAVRMSLLYIDFICNALYISKQAKCDIVKAD